MNQFHHLEIRTLAISSEELHAFLIRHGGSALVNIPEGVADEMSARGQFQGLFGVMFNGAECLLAIGGYVPKAYFTGPGGRLQGEVQVMILRHVVVHRHYRGSKLGALLGGHLFLTTHLATAGRAECVVAAMVSGDSAAADVAVKAGLAAVAEYNAFALGVSPGLAPFALEVGWEGQGLGLDTHIIYFLHEILGPWADIGKLMQTTGYRLPGLCVKVFSPYLDLLPATQKADLNGLVARDLITLIRYGLEAGPLSPEQSLTGRFSEWVGRRARR